MIPEIFPILSADSAVTSLLGTSPVRVFPFALAPQNVEAPYVTYAVVAGFPENTLDKTPEVDNLGTQVDVWAKTAEECLDVAKAVRDAIEPQAHMTRIGNMGRDAETMLYRIGMDFDFFTNR